MLMADVEGSQMVRSWDDVRFDLIIMYKMVSPKEMSRKMITQIIITIAFEFSATSLIFLKVLNDLVIKSVHWNSKRDMLTRQFGSDRLPEITILEEIREEWNCLGMIPKRRLLRLGRVDDCWPRDT